MKRGTEERFKAALERLKSNKGRLLQDGVRNVAISVSSVAREAGLGRATIYRHPTIIDAIKQARAEHEKTAPSQRSRRSARQSETIADLRKQLRDVLSRNLELALRLVKFDPDFDRKLIQFGPAELDQLRRCLDRKGQ